MQEAVRALSAVLESWLQSDSIPEVDWSRMRSLEFQETLRTRNERAKRLVSAQCTSCPDFDDHVSPFPPFSQHPVIYGI